MKRSRAVHPQQLSLFDTLAAIEEAKSSQVNPAQDPDKPTPTKCIRTRHHTPRPAYRWRACRVDIHPPVRPIRKCSRGPPKPTSSDFPLCNMARARRRDPISGATWCCRPNQGGTRGEQFAASVAVPDGEGSCPQAAPDPSHHPVAYPDGAARGRQDWPRLPDHGRGPSPVSRKPGRSLKGRNRADLDPLNNDYPL